MYVQPYVFFNGRCEEALEYYCEKLGAEVTFKMRYKEAPPDAENQPRPGLEDKIMHANVRMGSTDWMASDGNCDPAASSDERLQPVADGRRQPRPPKNTSTRWPTAAR